MPVQTKPGKARPSPVEEDPLKPLRNYSHLSVVDLLKARDFYHLHLTEKRGVIATAVGLYLIRKQDSHPGQPYHKGKGPRDLTNSEVRDYSWPCILAFVEKWVDEGKLPRDYSALDLLPKSLHMPDGKVIPVCVVEAPRDPSARAEPLDAVWPKEFIGGGYPLLVKVQGEQYTASVGCLVTDGHLTYAVTNRHVVGPPGVPVYSLLGGQVVEVGWSSNKQLTRLPFGQVYASWPGTNTFVNMDIGLVEVTESRVWTPQVYSIGKINHLADLTPDNLTLRLIGADVLAYGAASREMRGEIKALFYRYKSVGGTDYVADFLIGPQEGVPLQTRRGDSGTLWLLDRTKLAEPDDPPELPMPLAIQWGGHTFTDRAGVTRQSYALATSLTHVCRLLGVDVIREWGVDLPEYWGAVGHFTIGSAACTIVGGPNSKIGKFFAANRTRIAPAFEDITDKATRGLSKKPFVPLADVPDLAWKVGAFVRGPRGTAANGRPKNPEGPNHFADMDEAPPDGTPSLLDLCRTSLTAHLSPVSWVTHFRRFSTDGMDAALGAGLLPFRVAQIFGAMVDFVAQGDEANYLCAAGVLAHYVGDACQPLHISRLHHGDPDDPVMRTVHHEDGTTSQRNAAEDVHADYEAEMFRPHGEEMKQGVLDSLQANHQLIRIDTPRKAARRTIELMLRTFDRIPPKSITRKYADALRDGLAKSEVLDVLWAEFGADTIEAMADGCRLLASLWASAWLEGGGNTTMTQIKAVSQDRLVTIYGKKSFLRSHLLTEIGAHLTGF